MHSSASLQESRLNFLRENQRVLLCFQWPGSTTVNHEISAAKLSNTVAMLHQTSQASSKVAAPISLHHSFATSIFSCPMMAFCPACLLYVPVTAHLLIHDHTPSNRKCQSSKQRRRSQVRSPSQWSQLGSEWMRVAVFSWQKLANA